VKERATRDLMLDNGNNNEMSKKPQWAKAVAGRNLENQCWSDTCPGPKSISIRALKHFKISRLVDGPFNSLLSVVLAWLPEIPCSSPRQPSECHWPAVTEDGLLLGEDGNGGSVARIGNHHTWAGPTGDIRYVVARPRPGVPGGATGGAVGVNGVGRPGPAANPGLLRRFST
jgi:hypothetical protein